MLLLFLFIEIFFTPVSLLRCTGGSNCHINLNFNQILPAHKDLPKTCSIIETSFCSIYLKIDYDNQRVHISFETPSINTRSPYLVTDLLTSNPQASIILRYTVNVRIFDNNHIQLYVLLQCRTIDQCTERQLRLYWHRFITLMNRREIFINFHQLLYSNISNSINCFNDETHQYEQCSISDHICWASTNTTRKCTKYNYKICDNFIYSYNKVDSPHQLTSEDVHYVLNCHVNNCNNNETINKLSELARQFAENPWSMRNRNVSSSAIKLFSSYFIIFSFGFLS